MQTTLKLQRIAAKLYIVITILVFTFTLCFMTEYKDLFGLKLKQNAQISFFHDAILQTFNRQIFTFAILGILVILFSFLLEIYSKVPDKFALIVIELSLLACCACSIYALMNIPAIETFYKGLDFQYLKLEGLNNYESHFTTFRIGVGIYVVNIISCVFYGGALGLSHFKYAKTQRRKGCVVNG